ncbi:hypothetical protein XELAEV_18033722mg [Xenopus laevis]|uniref:Uncharacterized protein n=1 Tax=Xenopus laevis TaxID=8355 RepID=A0A974HE85_XENLA|nr:hypothetical protein XELAEV_18033722mg [Xenopus laevis]
MSMGETIHVQVNNKKPSSLPNLTHTHSYKGTQVVFIQQFKVFISKYSCKFTATSGKTPFFTFQEAQVAMNVNCVKHNIHTHDS